MVETLDILTGEIVPAVSIGALAAALAKAQGSFPPVTRSKTVTVTTKTGGSYKFSYAPLDKILDAVRKPLADNGLALAQLLDHGDLVTVLLHESGASIEGRTAIPATADVQALGSALTYLRRYAIQAMLGIAAEEDDDGKAAKDDAKPKAREYGRASFPAEEPAAEPVVVHVYDGMVQCESRSPFDEAVQCRKEEGHNGPHKTPNESWPRFGADAKSAPVESPQKPVA